jgi:predicted nucleotidyltransferase component of viral defense system
MDLREIRVIAITAIAADDLLMETLVLKGGNALEIVHGIGGRSSVDLDYSIEGDVPDLAEVERRLGASLRDRFDSVGFIVFDFVFKRRPTNSPQGARWGGYRAEFKIIERESYARLSGSLDDIRRNAHRIGALQERVFCIDISRHEYVKPKGLHRVDSYDCYVYTLPMILIEKLRALCQQLPGYAARKNRVPRPRDFYDIASIVEHGVDTAACGELVRPVFSAKEVPLGLIGDLHGSTEFHRPSWEAVQNAVARKLEPFDFYVERTLDFADQLKPWWMEDAPG